MNIEELAKATGHSVEDLQNLTEQELADLAEGETFDEDTEEELDPNTGEVTKADDANSNDDGADSNDDDDQGETEQAAEDESEQEQPDQQPAPDVAPPAVTLPDDFDDQIKAIEAEKEDLYTKFDEGDLTAAEYGKQLDELGKRERQLERIKDRAEIEDQQRRHNWVHVTVASFLDRHKEYRDNEMLYNLLDMEVIKLQQASDNQTDPAILAKAHEKIKAQLPQAFSEEAPSRHKAKKAPRTVPNLANVPAAEIDEPGATEFDYLDRLFETDTLRYEQELAKLQNTNPAKFEQYMAS